MVCSALAALCSCRGGRGDDSATDDDGGTNTNVDTNTYYHDGASHSRRAALVSMRRLSLFRGGGDVHRHDRRDIVGGASSAAIFGLRQLHGHPSNNNSSFHRSRRGRANVFADGERPPPGSGLTGLLRFYVIKGLVHMGLRYKRSDMEADYLIFFFSNQRNVAIAFCVLAFVLVGIGTLMWASTISLAFLVWDFFAVLVWGACAVGFVLLKRHNQATLCMLDDAVMTAGGSGGDAMEEPLLVDGNTATKLGADGSKNKKTRTGKSTERRKGDALPSPTAAAGGFDGNVVGSTVASRRAMSAKRSERELRWNALWHERLTLLATAAIVWFCIGLNGAQGSCDYVEEDRRQHDCREAINTEGLLFLFITTTVFLTPTRFCFLCPIYAVWFGSVAGVLRVAVPDIVPAYFGTHVILIATELVVAAGTLYVREHHRRFDFDCFMERQLRAAELESIRGETERMLTAQLPLEVTRRLAAAGALCPIPPSSKGSAMEFGGGGGARAQAKRHHHTYIHGWELSKQAVVCVFSLQGYAQWCMRRSPLDAIELVRCFFETLDAVRERFEQREEAIHFIGALTHDSANTHNVVASSGARAVGNVPPPISKFHTIGDHYIVVRDVSASFWNADRRTSNPKKRPNKKQQASPSIMPEKDEQSQRNGITIHNEEAARRQEGDAFGSNSQSFTVRNTPRSTAAAAMEERRRMGSAHNAVECEDDDGDSPQRKDRAVEDYDDAMLVHDATYRNALPMSSVCFDDAMCYVYCARSVTAATAAVHALCEDLSATVALEGSRLRNGGNASVTVKGMPSPLQVACGIGFGPVRGNFFVGSKNVAIEGPVVEDALSCLAVAPRAAAAIPIDGSITTTDHRHCGASAQAPAGNNAHAQEAATATIATASMSTQEIGSSSRPLFCGSSARRHVMCPAVAVSQTWLQAAVHVVSLMPAHTVVAASAASLSSSTALTNSSVGGVVVENPLNTPRRGAHSPNASSSTTGGDGDDFRGRLPITEGTTHHHYHHHDRHRAVAAALHRGLLRTLTALQSQGVLLPHQLRSNHCMRAFLSNNVAMADGAWSDVVVQVQRSGGCRGGGGDGPGGDDGVLLSPRSVGGGSGSGGSGNAPPRTSSRPHNTVATKRTAMEAPTIPLPIDGDTSPTPPMPTDADAQEPSGMPSPPQKALDGADDDHSLDTTLHERCLIFSTFTDTRTEEAYRSYLRTFTPQDAMWAAFASMLSLSALVGVMGQYNGLWGTLSDGLRSPLLLILIGYACGLVAIYLEWFYDVWKQFMEQPVPLLAGLPVRNALQCFLCGIVTLCYVGVTFAVPSEGNIVGNSQILWLLIVLNWSLIRPTWLHPLLLWVGDAMLCAAYLCRTYARFDMPSTSRLSLMYMEGAMLLYTLVTRMLLDQSKRAAFANELASKQLKEQLQRDQQRLEDTVRLLAPEGIAAQMLEHSKKVRRLRGAGGGFGLQPPPGTLTEAAAHRPPPQQFRVVVPTQPPPHPLTSTNWCTSVWEVPIAVIRLDVSLSMAAPLPPLPGGGGALALEGSLIRRRSTTSTAATGSVGMLTPRNNTTKSMTSVTQQQETIVAERGPTTNSCTTAAGNANTAAMSAEATTQQQQQQRPVGLPPIIPIPFHDAHNTTTAQRSAVPNRTPQHPPMGTAAIAATPQPSSGAGAPVQPGCGGVPTPPAKAAAAALLTAAHRIVVDTAANWQQLPFMRLELYKASTYELRVCVASLPGGANGERRDLDEERCMELLKFVAVVERKLQARLPKRTPTPPNSRRPSLDVTTATTQVGPFAVPPPLDDDGPFPSKAPTYRIALSVGPLVGGVVGRGSVSYDYYGPAVVEAVSMLDTAQVLGCAAPPVLLTRRFAKYCAAAHIDVPATLQRILKEEEEAKKANAASGINGGRDVQGSSLADAHDGIDDGALRFSQDEGDDDWNRLRDTIVPLGTSSTMAGAAGDGGGGEVEAKLSGSTSTDDVQAVLSKASSTWCLQSIGPIDVHYARFI